MHSTEKKNDKNIIFMGSLDSGMKMTLWRDFQVPGILLKGL